MKLHEWVEKQGGPLVVAGKLKIHPHTVRVWLRGDGAPKFKTLVKLLALSKWELEPKDFVMALKPGKRWAVVKRHLREKGVA